MAWKCLKHGKYRESLPGMLGKRVPSRPLRRAEIERCWMHSVSVGETVAAGSVHRELVRRCGDWEFMVTTTTETGQAQARRTMEGARHFAYAPFDFSWMVDHHLDAYRPTLYLFFETEIWPNTLLRTARRGIPIFLVNGKLSERSARRYTRTSFLFRPVLSGVQRFFMQTQQDAERLEGVIGDASRIEVTGNVKFDALPEPLTAYDKGTWRTKWGMSEREVVALAGSTHPGEEELIWEAFAEARRDAGALRLVIAPRHPERFDEAARLLEGFGAKVHRTSAGDVPSGSEPDVVLLDEMGVLARAFGACDIAMVAGSWRPVGGHNLLEAGVHGVPVLRGPFMQNQPDIVRVLGPENGAPEVKEKELGRWMRRLAEGSQERMMLGEKAQQAAQSMKGSAGRVVDGILNSIH